jgi:hypothetical protein
MYKKGSFDLYYDFLIVFSVQNILKLLLNKGKVAFAQSKGSTTASMISFFKTKDGCQFASTNSGQSAVCTIQQYFLLIVPENELLYMYK